VDWALWAQFLPLYFFLVVPPLWNWYRQYRARAAQPRRALETEDFAR
jgi:hypothetical protein